MTQATEVKYVTRSVKTVRGMEARTRAKLEKEGWEFVSQAQGTVRSELSFRKPAPKTPWLVFGILGGVLALLFAVIIVMNALTSGDDVAQEAAPSPTQTTTTAVPSPSATQSEDVTPSAIPEAPVPPVTDTTVDALLDQLNSAEMGGIKTGDRFRLTGELFMSDLWMTGVTGDYFVLLKAQGGAQDLMVIVDESDAAGWGDGTKVDMTVESVEVTIDGETTGGWLKAQSVTVIP